MINSEIEQQIDGNLKSIKYSKTYTDYNNLLMKLFISNPPPLNEIDDEIASLNLLWEKVELEIIIISKNLNFVDTKKLMPELLKAKFFYKDLSVETNKCYIEIFRLLDNIETLIFGIPYKFSEINCKQIDVIIKSILKLLEYSKFRYHIIGTKFFEKLEYGFKLFEKMSKSFITNTIQTKDLSKKIKKQTQSLKINE